MARGGEALAGRKDLEEMLVDLEVGVQVALVQTLVRVLLEDSLPLLGRRRMMGGTERLCSHSS